MWYHFNMRQKPWLVYFTAFIFASVLVFILFSTGVLLAAIGLIITVPYLAELVAGFFYSSFITSPLSILMIGILAKSHPPLQIAVIGGLGSMLTDLVLLKITRYLLFGSLSPLNLNLNFTKSIHSLHRNSLFNLLAPWIGALMIASPLPDELGVAVLGLTKLSAWIVAPITYFLNAVGIYFIVIIIRQLP